MGTVLHLWFSALLVVRCNLLCWKYWCLWLLPKFISPCLFLVGSWFAVLFRLFPNILVHWLNSIMVLLLVVLIYGCILDTYCHIRGWELVHNRVDFSDIKFLVLLLLFTLNSWLGGTLYTWIWKLFKGIGIGRQPYCYFLLLHFLI